MAIVIIHRVFDWIVRLENGRGEAILVFSHAHMRVKDLCEICYGWLEPISMPSCEHPEYPNSFLTQQRKLPAKNYSQNKNCVKKKQPILKQKNDSKITKQKIKLVKKLCNCKPDKLIRWKEMYFLLFCTYQLKKFQFIIKFILQINTNRLNVKVIVLSCA